MNIERGDSVKFGEKWCKEHGRENLINQVIKFTPQWFEDDNFFTLIKLNVQEFIMKNAKRLIVFIKGRKKRTP
ncbi:hypothetical protein ACFTQ7_02195 [Lysinibacillus sp. NPDC056959]|uniref:hypothetical protein n=1 Tax=Lysinibacillus sp. NPDC056959 TaxID=3345981 RepID=UPI00362B84DC